MSTHSWLQHAERFRPIADPAQTPIYRADGDAYALFYAPGCLCVTASSSADAFEAALHGTTGPGDTPPAENRAPLPNAVQQSPAGMTQWSAALLQHAGRATRERTRQQREPFASECLTLYLNNECNLNCTYCYAAPSAHTEARLEIDEITAAAQTVAEVCRKEDRPLTVVLHGGGEPTLHRERVDRAMALLEEIARAHGIALWSYTASNGVMSEQKARWMARRFDRVGLSCDGPPEIQDRQRPRQGGGSSARMLERTARILEEEGCPYQVRATITGATLDRQAEIAEYICQRMAPVEIRFEPVYLGGRTGSDAGIAPDRASAFVEHLLLAQDKAAQYGVPLETSGSRLGEIHGPYCNVHRAVLNLVPGGVATACFKHARIEPITKRGLAIGHLDHNSGRYAIDGQRIERLRERLTALPDECEDCLNRYHCVRGCPDACPLDDREGPHDDLSSSFRCRAQKALSYARLHRTAESLWTDPNRVSLTDSRLAGMPSGPAFGGIVFG
jgi:sulfatase maturation enzyme AslB (radical SAM superfamily)